MTKRLV